MKDAKDKIIDRLYISLIKKFNFYSDMVYLKAKRSFLFLRGEGAKEGVKIGVSHPPSKFQFQNVSKCYSEKFLIDLSCNYKI